MQRPTPGRAMDILAEYLAERPRTLFLLQIVPPLAFILVFVFVPMVSIFTWSFWSVEAGRIVPRFSLEGYLAFFGLGYPGFRFQTFLQTLRIAATQTAIAAVVGFAIAYFVGIKMRNSRFTLPLLLLFAIPFLTNYLVRTQSWWMMLQDGGFLNSTYTFLASLLGYEVQPLPLLFNEFAMHLGFLSTYLPFMIFPVWLAMSRIDETVLAASADLGGRPFHTLFHVVIPLTMPGILIGAVFVFVGVLGDNVVPFLLGGPGDRLLANLIDGAIQGTRYDLAGAMASIVLLLAFGLILVWEKFFGLKRIGEI